jgi:protease I
MANELNGRRVLFMTANEGVEQRELTEPWQSVVEAGGQPELAAPEAGKVQLFQHLDPGDVWEATLATSDVRPSDYDALVLPGGVANADQLRMDTVAVDVVRRMVADGKPVAVICHGPWPMVEADVLRGRTITSWPSVRTDIVNAGGLWVDEEVHVDGAFISSRKPDDLPAFCRTLVEVFAAQP